MAKNELIVISGVNIVDGGALVVFKDAVSAIVNNNKGYRICVLVNKKSLFDDLNLQDVLFLEYPDIKKRWINRVFFEYVYSYFLSRKLKPKAWLSMHDITPNVKSDYRFVYCHNPSPFYSSSFFDLLYEPKIVAFSVFYKFLYGINIKKNESVFVQQEWLKSEFTQKYDLNSVIVARPESKIPLWQSEFILPAEVSSFINSRKGKFVFYPAYPRVFKNIEIILEVAVLSQQKEIDLNFIITVDGTENKYSSFLKKKYSKLSNVLWLGLLPHESIMSIYPKCDLLCFPSKLETWGLPLTEAIHFNIPISCSDLPYAHETTKGYKRIDFFDPGSPSSALSSIVKLLYGQQAVDVVDIVDTSTSNDILEGWSEFSDYIFSKLDGVKNV